MKGNTRRALAIFLILAIALGVGFAVDAAWTLIEKKTHPQDYADLISLYATEYNIPSEIV